MKFLVALMCLSVCRASVLLGAPALIRAPAHDSAIIRSDRLGGNFAYSVHEGHAYAAVSPVIQHVQTPVAVSYHAPAVTYAAQPIVYEAPRVQAAAVGLKTLAYPFHYPYTVVKSD